MKRITYSYFILTYNNKIMKKSYKSKSNCYFKTCDKPFIDKRAYGTYNAIY